MEHVQRLLTVSTKPKTVSISYNHSQTGQIPISHFSTDHGHLHTFIYYFWQQMPVVWLVRKSRVGL